MFHECENNHRDHHVLVPIIRRHMFVRGHSLQHMDGRPTCPFPTTASCMRMLTTPESSLIPLLELTQIQSRDAGYMSRGICNEELAG